MKALLPEELAVDSIRLQAAALLGPWLQHGKEHGMGVAECLALFTVGVGALQSIKAGTLLKHVAWDGRWHVQLHDAHEVVGYARVREGAEGLSVCSLSRDSMAARIDVALQQADSERLDQTHGVVLLEARPIRFLSLLFVPRQAGARYWAWPLRLPGPLAPANLYKPVPMNRLLKELAPVEGLGAIVDLP